MAQGSNDSLDKLTTRKQRYHRTIHAPGTLQNGGNRKQLGVKNNHHYLAYPFRFRKTSSSLVRRITKSKGFLVACATKKLFPLGSPAHQIASRMGWTYNEFDLRRIAPYLGGIESELLLLNNEEKVNVFSHI